ncbi:hypothetical protein CCYA_CCYA14G3682 [Cyanidiococcus yangmingshanensis]|nr:hypothetical protein CCYA_CCYA14G3682 [Cyanidiococcus yangmingshanensis]
MAFVQVPGHSYLLKRAKVSASFGDRRVLKCCERRQAGNTGDSVGLTRRESIQRFGLALLLALGVVSPRSTAAAPLVLNPFAGNKSERAPKGKKEQKSKRNKPEAREPPKSKKSPTGSLSQEDQEDIDELTKRLMTRNPGSEPTGK